jgi:23S rRNA (adenine2030-N6)-methyltransferase
MNYRHAFHAGNFADVVKHLTLSRILVYLMRKPAAFRVLDTHAGAGLYDLSGDQAQRTGEWSEGIGRLLAEPLAGEAAALAAPYLEAVRSFNPDGELRFYPGSPLLARRLMRDRDRMFALELHPGDHELLAENFAGDIQVRVTKLDGWAALGTHVPPKEKRGLVLVDPPFEEKGEFGRLVEGLVRAHARWPGGIYALWYPLKDPTETERFHARLRDTGIAKTLRIELALRAPSTPPRLNGTGMIVVNPPFVLAEEMAVLLPALTERLSQASTASWRCDWIAGE